MLLKEDMFEVIREEAARRGVSIQEFLRTVILPNWLKTHGDIAKFSGSEHGTFPNDVVGQNRPLLASKMEEIAGIFSDQDGRILIMPGRLMHSIQDLLTKTFGPIAATNILYEMGREAGRYYLKVLGSAGYKLTNPRQLQKVREELAPLWGWGRLHAMEFDARNRLVLSKFKGSIYVRNRRGRTPVCHFGRGMAAGSLGAVFGRRSESIEVACEGMRDDYCELVTGAPTGIVRFAENLNGQPKPRN